MGLEIFQPRKSFGAVFKRASMRLFGCMPPHVHHQHILGLERLFFSGAVLPKTDKGLLAVANMVIVQMLDELFLSELDTITACPVAMSPVVESRVERHEQFCWIVG